MGVFAGVVLDVGVLDRHAERTAVLELDIQIAFAVGRLVGLGDLIVARHVRVEVVLAGELTPLVDMAMEGQAQTDAVDDGLSVDHRQGTR